MCNFADRQWRTQGMRERGRSERRFTYNYKQRFVRLYKKNSIVKSAAPLKVTKGMYSVYRGWEISKLVRTRRLAYCSSSYSLSLCSLA